MYDVIIVTVKNQYTKTGEAEPAIDWTRLRSRSRDRVAENEAGDKVHVMDKTLQSKKSSSLRADWSEQSSSR